MKLCEKSPIKLEKSGAIPDAAGMNATRVFGLIAGLALINPAMQADDLKREQDLSSKEGKPAPAIEADGWMNTPDNQPIDLAALKGKVVVIDFWGTW